MGIAHTVSTIFEGKDKLSKTFNRMGKNAKKFGEKTSKAFGKASKSANKFSSITKGILKAGAITKGLDLIKQGVGAVASEFLDFDDAITRSSAKFKGLNLLTKEGQQTLLDLKKAAREVGATTKFSAAQAAGGLDFYATAGFNAAQAMAVLKPTAKLATIANLDLARTSDIASDSLGAFGLMTKDSTQLQKNFTRISDVMAKTMTSTNTNMEDMFEAIKKGAPTFTSTGQRIETFNALMGTMANSGVKGSEAGTQLRNIMLRLAKPTKESQVAMEALGVQTRDSKGNFRDIIDVLADFEKGLKGKGTAERASTLATVFGARAVTGVNLLLQEGTENLRTFRTELDNSSGATDAMAKVINQSLMNRLLGLKSAAIDVGFQLFSAFAGEGGSSIDFLTEKLRQIDLKPMIAGIKTVAGFAGNLFERFKAIGERTGLFDKITIGVKAIIPHIKVLFDIFKTIFNLFERVGVFDAMAKAIGFVIDALVFMSKKFTEAWNIAKPFIEGIKSFSDIFGIGDETATKKEKVNPPPRVVGELIKDRIRESESRFSGQLNIAGAPDGSTFTPSVGSNNDINVAIMGVE